MVGVAGRSKGCHTCKKRKVKCDETKPACKRCPRAGYTCGGYARDLVFRITTPSGAGTVDTISKTTTHDQRIRTHDHIPAFLPLTPFAPSLLHTHLFTNFIWSSYGSPWLQASTTGALGPLAQKTTLAFASAIFARRHHDPRTAVVGARMYGDVVAAVRTGLGVAGVGGGGKKVLGALLAPIVILLMYAASAPAAEREGTANHVMGLFALLQSAGPKAFRRRPLRDAFSSCRATLVICGLLQKKRSFLEEEAWRVVPWELEPAKKGEQDRLVDVLVLVPGFLEDQTKVMEVPDVRAKTDLVGRVEAALRALLEWRWRWEGRSPRAAWEESRESRLPGMVSPPNVAKDLLVFSSFTAAVEIALYNAVLLCLLGLLFSELPHQQAQTHIAFATHGADPPHPVQNNTALNLPSTPLYLRAAAVEIVRAFEYQLRHARSTQESALFWLFPFGLAAKVLQDDVETWAWIQQMLDESEVTRGYGRGDNAFGFGMYNLPKVDERVAELPDEMIVLRPAGGL